MRTLKNPTKCLWRWEPDRRSNYFFFSPPAHLFAVTCMTEISLIVTLNNQFTSPQTITDSLQVLSQIHFRILLDYKCSTWYLTSVAERYTALTFLAWTGVVWVRIPLETYFHFEFFAPSPFRTGQRSPCKWNQAWPFTCIHSCFTLHIRLII